MTPRNPLDKKVIVDRELFRALYLLARNSDTGKLREEDAVTCRELWNQDLTGWAAIPVLSTIQMDVDGVSEMLGDEFAGLDSDVAAKVWNAMINASPPLPGGGE